MEEELSFKRDLHNYLLENNSEYLNLQTRSKMLRDELKRFRIKTNGGKNKQEISRIELLKVEIDSLHERSQILFDSSLQEEIPELNNKRGVHIH